MNDLEIRQAYCNKCKNRGTCITPCPTVWFAVLQREDERSDANDSRRTDQKTE